MSVGAFTSIISSSINTFDTITQTIRTVMTMFIHIKEKLFAYNSITIADGHKQGTILMEHIFLPRQPLLSGKIIR
ncbi:hypothetical protein I3679_014965 [Proteus mirabilis]|uniref:Phage protein n=1 Tax=Proteus mirabilis TaxID=584 RepID=A0ABD5LW71_PROMI